MCIPSQRIHPIPEKVLEIVFVVVALNRQGGQMCYPLNQPQFKRRGTPRNTAEHLERSQNNILIPQRNTGRPKNMQAKLQSALRNRTKIVFLVFRRQDNRDIFAYLKIDSSSQFVQDSGERCTHRNQLENALFSTQKHSLFAGALSTQRKSARHPLGARFVLSHRSHLMIEAPRSWAKLTIGVCPVQDTLGHCLLDTPETQGSSKHAEIMRPSLMSNSFL
jgi:hypothetical protein